MELLEIGKELAKIGSTKPKTHLFNSPVGFPQLDSAGERKEGNPCRAETRQFRDGGVGYRTMGHSDLG